MTRQFLLCALFIMAIVGTTHASRNPFRPIFIPKDRIKGAASPRDYTLNQITLRAVIWGIEKSVALFEGEDGRTFHVKKGDIIGKKGGRIDRIGDKIVVVRGSFGKRTFKIRGY